MAALPCAAAIHWLGGWPWLLAAAIAVFAVGVWASARYAVALGGDDPGAVVVDEVAGQWLTLVPLAMEPLAYLLGFAAFRLFDIVKPWPVGWCDRHVKGGLGIMLDDVVAAVYAAAVAYALSYWLRG